MNRLSAELNLQLWRFSPNAETPRITENQNAQLPQMQTDGHR
jgi:hypothetical protein